MESGLPRKKALFKEVISEPPTPLKQCNIHSKPYTEYKDGTRACVLCVALDAVKNLGTAKGFLPRMWATISDIEESVIRNMFQDEANKKGITIELLFSMLLCGYAHRYSLTFDEVIKMICVKESAVMIIPSP